MKLSNTMHANKYNPLKATEEYGEQITEVKDQISKITGAE